MLEIQEDDFMPIPDLYQDYIDQAAEQLDESKVLSAIIQKMIYQRHYLNLSQRELAELCGVPHSTIARIESGKLTPNVSTLLKICSRLGLKCTVEPVQIESRYHPW